MTAVTVDPFQISFHPKLGVVIFDRLAQLSLPADQVRLFKIDTMSATTFRRDIVYKDMTACGDELLRKHRAVLKTDRTARPSGKKAYCEHCRRHFGSVDFAVCSDCSAIRCTCGACSCATRKRKTAGVLKKVA